MVTAFYQILLVLSAALSILYVMVWHKHFDTHITLIFVMVPVTLIGFAALANSRTLEEAMLANKINYFGGTFLVLMITLAILHLCDISLSRWIKSLMFIVSTLIYLSVLICGFNDSGWFYKSCEFAVVDGAGRFTGKEYGPMHTVFVIVVMLYFAMGFAAMVYSYFFRNSVPNKVILLMFIPEVLSVIAFFGRDTLFGGVEMLPLTYVIAQIMYLIIVQQVCLYDITDSGIDSLVQTGDKGFLSFDFRRHYLGGNKTALAVFPELNDIKVDSRVPESSPVAANIKEWLDGFEQSEENNTYRYRHDDRIYVITVTYLFSGRRKRGYQFFITDDTRQQQYLELLNNFNTQLQQQVEEKTQGIVEMHDKLILGMAAMVESRDNSTGGHIRRTSEGVRILTEEIRKDNAFGITDAFAEKLIKAAPMHDLGKIAVDDEILRKPGRFEPWEFEKMKTHAAEGARIVHGILQGTDDEVFHHVAENMAHYHHERWDGSGYPEKLKGEEIPMEARIMAVADVYDALVSKRVYKESLSFEKADAIIMDGMGSQFDPALKPYYEAARPRLERYYRSDPDSHVLDSATCS